MVSREGLGELWVQHAGRAETREKGTGMGTEHSIQIGFGLSHSSLAGLNFLFY